MQIPIEHPNLTPYASTTTNCSYWLRWGYRLAIRPLSGDILHPNVASDALITFVSHRPSLAELESSQVLLEDNLDESGTPPEEWGYLPPIFPLSNDD